MSPVLLLSLCLLLRCISAQIDSSNTSCPVEYLEQPPDQLDCNPYPRGELLLECSASLQSEYLHLLDAPLSVNWYHTKHISEAELRQVLTEDTYQLVERPLAITLLDNSQENVSIIEQTLAFLSSGEVLVRSRLNVYGLSESDMGAYWCSIHLNYTNESLSETAVVPSDSVLLKHPHEHAHKKGCSTDIAQSKQRKKCALHSSIFPPPLPALPWPDSKATIVPESETTPQSSAEQEQVTVVGEKLSEEEEEKGSLKEFYIALGILVAFGSVIAALALSVVCTCVKYRKMLKAKRALRKAQEAVILQSLSPSDYLVPLASGDLSLTNTQANSADKPVYISAIATQQHLTSRWLQQHYQQQNCCHQQNHELQQHCQVQQQQDMPRRSEMFVHSYETIMSHDYEDMAGILTHDNPMLMKRNEAYVPISTFTLQSQLV